MTEQPVGLQTTVRLRRGEAAYQRFARPSTLSERALAVALPVLWGLVVVVVVATLWWVTL